MTERDAAQDNEWEKGPMTRCEIKDCLHRHDRQPTVHFAVGCARSKMRTKKTRPRSHSRSTQVPHAGYATARRRTPTVPTVRTCWSRLQRRVKVTPNDRRPPWHHPHLPHATRGTNNRLADALRCDAIAMLNLRNSTHPPYPRQQSIHPRNHNSYEFP
jgi:hypothetical protein